MAMIEPWKTSKAKAILKKDIIDGIVTDDMTPKMVHAMRAEYKEYDISKFGNNLRNLRRALKKHMMRAEQDTIDLDHDKKLYPRGQLTNRNEPFWDGSAAQMLLKQDVKMGMHGMMTPKQLWNLRDAYKIFTLEKFKNHLNSEKQSLVGSSYWMKKNKNDEKINPKKNTKNYVNLVEDDL